MSPACTNSTASLWSRKCSGIAIGLCFGITICSETLAASQAEIAALNTRATVYLELQDANGDFLDSGTGFVVSHDGYVLTAAHLKSGEGRKLWAIVGQRAGTKYELQFREADELSDVALWQLPQSAACRRSSVLSTTPVRGLDRALVLGFPGRDGLTPAPVTIVNPSTPEGLYKADGFLRNGYSGGPVFSENGRVVALVRSGTPAGGNNDLVPIAPAINLLRKRGVSAGIDAASPFDISCYSVCRTRSNGVEKWTSENHWQNNTGELSGGHNRRDECNRLIAAALANNPDSRIDLLPGDAGMWEQSHKDFAGQVHYKYFCKGILKSGPIYLEKQSVDCGLWE